MKKTYIFILLILGLVAPIKFYGQEYSYSYQGHSFKLKLPNNRFIILSEKGFNAQILSTFPFVKEIFKISDQLDIHLISTESNYNNGLQIIGKLINIKGVKDILPIVVNDKDEEIGALTKRVILRLNSQMISRTMLETTLSDFRIKTIFRYEFDSLTYQIEIDPAGNINGFELSEALLKTNLFEFVQPDFLLFVNKTTADPYYNLQWALNNTGQGGGLINDSDMDVAEAWTITQGCNIVKIAIIDQGVYLTHPDLDANILPGYDALGLGSGGAPNGSENHGTNCAGVVAAESNSIGVAGIAYNSKIVPIRAMVSGSGIYDLSYSSWLSSSIDWAWQNNRSDILSMSLRIAVGQPSIDAAIDRAISLGRNGLGCIIVAAAGNDNNSSISYPSSNSHVISVGASTGCDTRKSPSSCDGNGFWGSNYGVGLDVVAPRVSIYTTSNFGYNSNFFGTSAACPQVAGVLALILSVNPTLSQQQARYILESSADKVSGYSYSSNIPGQPNGTWNTEVGYGRVNAFNAVKATVGAPMLGGYFFCSSNSFALQNPPANASIVWYSNNPFGVSINPANGFASIINDYGGPITINASINISSCASTVSESIAWVGKPYNHYPTGYTEDCSGVPIYFQAITNPNAQVYNYRWYLDGSLVSETFNSFEYISAPLGNHTVGLQVANDCGWSPQIETQNFEIINCNGFNGYSTYPNPSDNEFVVSYSYNDAEKDQNFKASLFNQFGQLIDSHKSNNGIVKFKTSNLQSGIYYLKIECGREIMNKQIFVEH